MEGFIICILGLMVIFLWAQNVSLKKRVIGDMTAELAFCATTKHPIIVKSEYPGDRSVVARFKKIQDAVKYSGNTWKPAVILKEHKPWNGIGNMVQTWPEFQIEVLQTYISALRAADALVSGGADGMKDAAQFSGQRAPAENQTGWTFVRN